MRAETTAASVEPRLAHPLALVPASMVTGSAVFLYALELQLIGYLVLVLGLAAAFVLDRSGLSTNLVRDLGLIAAGLVIISTISVAADISYGNMVLMGAVLALAVAVPYLLARFVFRERLIRFPWRDGDRWGRVQWGYLVFVLVAAWLLLPFYFITSGVYLNWPTVTEPDQIARLFVGVNAVGIWDELFFICTVFVLLRRHFPVLQANLLQAVVFVAFLWELGYQAWGPALTIPFALLQGYIFTRTRSLFYVICVHLLFDLFVFLIIVHAHNPGALPIFLL